MQYIETLGYANKSVGFAAEIPELKQIFDHFLIPPITNIQKRPTNK